MKRFRPTRIIGASESVAEPKTTTWKTGGQLRKLEKKGNAPRKWGERARRVNFLLALSRGSRYLEIGVWGGETLEVVRAREKLGVDPNPLFDLEALPKGVKVFTGTSREFFGQYSGPSFDVVFVDGLHESSTAYLDVTESFNLLAPGGWLLLDDVCPPSEELADHGPYGDVWRVASLLVTQYADIRAVFIGDGNSQHVQLAIQKPLGSLPTWSPLRDIELQSNLSFPLAVDGKETGFRRLLLNERDAFKSILGKNLWATWRTWRIRRAGA
jgi:hypothetical protein